MSASRRADVDNVDKKTGRPKNALSPGQMEEARARRSAGDAKSDAREGRKGRLPSTSPAPAEQPTPATRRG